MSDDATTDFLRRLYHFDERQNLYKDRWRPRW